MTLPAGEAASSDVHKFSKLKVALIGDECTGKSAAVSRITGNVFPVRYQVNSCTANCYSPAFEVALLSRLLWVWISFRKLWRWKERILDCSCGIRQEETDTSH